MLNNGYHKHHHHKNTQKMKMSKKNLMFNRMIIMFNIMLYNLQQQKKNENITSNFYLNLTVAKIQKANSNFFEQKTFFLPSFLWLIK